MATIEQERNVGLMRYIEKAQNIGCFGKNYLHRCIVWLTATSVSICSLLYGVLMLKTPPKVEISMSTNNRFFLSTKTDSFLRLTVVVHLPKSMQLLSVLTEERYGVEINGQINHSISYVDSSTQTSIISRSPPSVSVNANTGSQSNQLPQLSMSDIDIHWLLHLLEDTLKYSLECRFKLQIYKFIRKKMKNRLKERDQEVKREEVSEKDNDANHQKNNYGNIPNQEKRKGPGMESYDGNGKTENKSDATKDVVKNYNMCGVTVKDFNNKNVIDVSNPMSDKGKPNDHGIQTEDKTIISASYKENYVYIKLAYQTNQTKRIQTVILKHADGEKEIVAVDDNYITIEQTDCYFNEEECTSFSSKKKDNSSTSHCLNDIPSAAQCPSKRNNNSSIKPSTELTEMCDTRLESDRLTTSNCSPSTTVHDNNPDDDSSSKSISQDVHIIRGRRMKNSTARRRRHSYPFTHTSQLKSCLGVDISLDNELRMQMNAFFVSKPYAPIPSIVWRSMHPLVTDKIRRLDDNK